MKFIVSVVQMQVKQADVAANLAKGEEFIREAARRGSRVIAFPEMWTSGFNFKKNLDLAKDQEKTIATIAAFAKQYNIWITGSMLTANPEGKPRNTAILVNPEGKIVARYSKIHLFSYIHEDQYETPGDCITVAETPWGTTGFSICYDIRFPELFRTLALQNALVIFSPIAVPYPRLEPWQVLVRARAIENQLFMIAANQIGTEVWEVQGEVVYFGHSSIIDPLGKTVIEAGDEQEVLLTAEIDMDLVNQTRANLNVLKDRRPDLYRL